MKKAIAVAAMMLLPSLSLASTAKIKFNYGEPGPSAGTGFADLNPTDQSDASEKIRSTMNEIQQWIADNLNNPAVKNSRLIVDIAADHVDGPVIRKDGQLQTQYRVRLRVQRHRAVFEHRIYEISGNGDVFRDGLINAVQDFIARPNVAQLIGYDHSESVALN